MIHVYNLTYGIGTGVAGAADRVRHTSAVFCKSVLHVEGLTKATKLAVAIYDSAAFYCPAVNASAALKNLIADVIVIGKFGDILDLFKRLKTCLNDSVGEVAGRISLVFVTVYRSIGMAMYAGKLQLLNLSGIVARISPLPVLGWAVRNVPLNALPIVGMCFDSLDQYLGIEKANNGGINERIEFYERAHRMYKTQREVFERYHSFGGKEMAEDYLNKVQDQYNADHVEMNNVIRDVKALIEREQKQKEQEGKNLPRVNEPSLQLKNVRKIFLAPSEDQPNQQSALLALARPANIADRWFNIIKAADKTVLGKTLRFEERRWEALAHNEKSLRTKPYMGIVANVIKQALLILIEVAKWGKIPAAVALTGIKPFMLVFGLVSAGTAFVKVFISENTLTPIKLDTKSEDSAKLSDSEVVTKQLEAITTAPSALQAVVSDAAVPAVVV